MNTLSRDELIGKLRDIKKRYDVTMREDEDAQMRIKQIETDFVRERTVGKYYAPQSDAEIEFLSMMIPEDEHYLFVLVHVGNETPIMFEYREPSENVWDARNLMRVICDLATNDDDFGI